MTEEAALLRAFELFSKQQDRLSENLSSEIEKRESLEKTVAEHETKLALLEKMETTVDRLSTIVDDLRMWKIKITAILGFATVLVQLLIELWKSSGN